MSELAKETKNSDLGTAPIGKLLFRLAVPSITAQLINALYNIVDRIYIGRLPGEGKLALAGLGIAFPIIMIISAFAALIGMGGAPLAAIKMGEENPRHAEKILGNCFTALIGLSVVLTSFFFLTKDTLLYWFGASDNTFDLCQPIPVHLPHWHPVCSVVAGPQPVHHDPGVRLYGHEDGADRRCYQHHIGPDFYIRPQHGSPRGRAGHDYRPVCFGGLGTVVFIWKKDHFENSPKKPEA